MEPKFRYREHEKIELILEVNQRTTILYFIKKTLKANRRDYEEKVIGN